MELTTAHYIQMIAAVGAGLAFFVALYMLPTRASYSAFVLLIPFQIVDSRYGSLNAVLAYMLFAAYALLGHLKYLPLLGPIALILLAYGISFGFAPTHTWSVHLIYLFSFLTNLLVFFIAYNVARQDMDWRYFRKLMIALNLLVVGYCFIQIVVPNEFEFGGISEFAMGSTRADRLTGPFQATAATAEYLVLMCMLLLYIYLVARKPLARWAALGLLGVNTGLVLMTGNRGGFVLYVLGCIFFLYGFRKQLGSGRIVSLVTTAVVFLIIASAIVVSFSRFNVIYDRLVATELESGFVPDTRAATWEDSVEAISEAPIIGHGPRFFMAERGALVNGNVQIDFPHSLPLFILYTTGVIGLLAFIVFFGALARRLSLYAFQMPRMADREIAGIPRLSLIVFLLFLVSQLRIEMLRTGLWDYQHFVFMFFGTLLGFCDQISRAQYRAVKPSATIDIQAQEIAS